METQATANVETPVKKPRGRKATLTGPKKQITAQVSEDVYNEVVKDFPSVTVAVRAVFDFYLKNRK